MTLEELLSEHTPEIRQLTDEIRQLVRRVIPHAEERIYPGWHGVGYVHPSAGYVCGIFPGVDQVKLGFEHGSELADPTGLLVGGGKRVRYVIADPGSEMPLEEISDLIEDTVWQRARR